MRLWHGTQTKFSRFNLHFSCDMGFHFATDAAQAKSRLHNTNENGEWYLLECEVAINNPIILPDIGDWADHQLLSEAILNTQDDPRLREIARKYLNTPYSFTGKMPHFQMAEEILAAGYGGICYENVGEGFGKSYMVFSESQIEILK